MFSGIGFDAKVAHDFAEKQPVDYLPIRSKA